MENKIHIAFYTEFHALQERCMHISVKKKRNVKGRRKAKRHMIVSPETVCWPSPLRGDKGRRWPRAELIFRQSKKGCNHAVGQIVWHLHTTLMVVENKTDFGFHKSPTKGRKHKQTITRHCENERQRNVMSTIKHLLYYQCKLLAH